MEFAGDFKKEWDCLEALHETGGCVGNIGNTESEIKLHELWIRDFYKTHQKKTGNGFWNYLKNANKNIP